MREFKVGDKIRRISYNHNEVKVGRVYTIKALIGTKYVQLTGITGFYSLENFVLVARQPPEADPEYENLFI